MNEKIRIHVNKLFEKAPNTKRVNDLKDEIISNANDKYNDYVQNGKTEEEAYVKVIEEIGDVDELVEELVKASPINQEGRKDNRQKTALVVSISVGLYILSIISIAVLEELALPEFVSISAFFMIAGLATCLLIYHFMSRPKYSKYEDTMVEEFKEWNGRNDKNTEIRKAIDSIIWTLTTIIYLTVSFLFGIWYISWIIFIIAVLIQQIVNLIFKLGEKEV